MGSQVIGSELAKTLVTIWMRSEYTPGGRSEPKVRRIVEYDHSRAASGSGSAERQK
jgi:ribose 5-phosphate isomerase B